MTLNGAILIVLWILSLVAISFFGGPVSYGIFAVITLIPVASLLYLLLVFLRFKIYQKMDARHVVANTVSDFYITLQNEDFFTFSGIKIKFFSPFSSVGGIDDSAEYELMPHSGISKETSLLCKYWGEYEVGVKSIIITDYFRIFRFTYKIPEPFRVYVHPQIIQLEALKTITSAQVTSRDSYRNLSEIDATVRDYIPGDDIRKIHWKSTARTGKLLTRKTIGEEKQGIGIVMDCARYSENPEEYLPIENKMMEIVIALTMYFVRNNISIRSYMYALGLSDMPVKNIDEFNNFYSNISNVRFDKENTVDAMLGELLSDRSVFDNKLMVFVLHEWNETVSEALDTLCENNVSSVVYLVNDDKVDVKPGKINSLSDLFIISSDADLKEEL